jgi:hypothetical protein
MTSTAPELKASTLAAGDHIPMPGREVNANEGLLKDPEPVKSRVAEPVPRVGETNVGLFDSTVLPVPVEVVTPVPPLATARMAEPALMADPS